MQPHSHPFFENKFSGVLVGAPPNVGTHTKAYPGCVKRGHKELGDAVTKAVIWCVKDFVCRGLKSCRRFGPGSELLDSLNLLLEFRPGVNECLPARLNAISL
jgi:hypothetical protein